MNLYSVAALAAIVAASPAGCPQQNGPDLKTILSQVKGDIALVEGGIAAGSLAFCSQLPQLQATADVIVSMTTIDAKTSAEIAAGKAAAASVCNNPTSTNLAALAVKAATAKAAVTKALKAAQ